MARPRFKFIFVLTLSLWFASPLAYAAPPLVQPSWTELTPEQRAILAPLANEWGNLEGFRRKKWLGIAQRYKSLAPDEQARIQGRMAHWAKLSPDERKQARDKYLALKKAHPEQKDAVKQKWQEYKDLPESEKERLKAAAASRPAPRPGKAKAPIAPGKPLSATPPNAPTASVPPKNAADKPAAP